MPVEYLGVSFCIVVIGSVAGRIDLLCARRFGLGAGRFRRRVCVCCMCRAVGAAAVCGFQVLAGSGDRSGAGLI